MAVNGDERVFAVLHEFEDTNDVSRLRYLALQLLASLDAAHDTATTPDTVAQ